MAGEHRDPESPEPEGVDVNEWPSFREWQTTRLPADHALRCQVRWLERDVQAIIEALWNRLRAALAAVTEAFQTFAEGLAPLADLFSSLGSAAKASTTS